MPERAVPVEHPSPIATPARLWIAATLYAVLAALSLRLAQDPTGAVAIWPASGLFVAVLLLVPPERRTATTLLFGLAHYLGGFAGTTAPLPHLLFSMIVALEGWLAAFLMRTVDPRPPRFDRLPDVGRLLVGGCVAAGAVGGLLAAVVASAVFADPFLQAWRDWWLPDAVGMLVVTPLVVRIAVRSTWREVRATRVTRVAEALALALALYSMAMYVFLAPQPRIPLAVSVLPFLVWAALRFGVAGISSASLLLWGIASFSSSSGGGPFAALSSTAMGRLAWSHIYIAVTGGLVLLIATVMAERQAVSEQLESSVRGLRDAYARAQALIASAPDMLGAVDDELRIIAFNPAWAREFARVSDVVPTIGLDLGHVLQSRGSVWADTALGGWLRALAGEKFSARRGPDVIGLPREMLVEFSPIRDDAARIIGAVQIVRDITNERRRQQAEAQARRDESVGQLAGGIAHDFNNIITGILAYASLLEHSLEAGDERRLDVVEIERAAGRAAELTSQLLAYARRQEVAPQDVEPNAVLRGAEQLLRRLLGADVELVADLAPDIWHVRVDPAQLERVLVNLAINARDAMPDGGRLRLASTNVTMQESDLPQQASGAGDYVRIDVNDTGQGIPPELFENIFEPFFTTKAIGKGTGLGLASVFGVLQQSGGAISVQSAVGIGTTFSVYLPRSVAPRSLL